LWNSGSHCWKRLLGNRAPNGIVGQGCAVMVWGRIMQDWPKRKELFVITWEQEWCKTKECPPHGSHYRNKDEGGVGRETPLDSQYTQGSWIRGCQILPFCGCFSPICTLPTYIKLRRFHATHNTFSRHFDYHYRGLCLLEYSGTLYPECGNIETYGPKDLLYSRGNCLERKFYVRFVIPKLFCNPLWYSCLNL
jgi:hypothetical protein